MGDKMGSTYIELKGTFTFAINQSGLEYNDPGEREEAIRDFKQLLEEWASEPGTYATIDYDENNIKVEEGEE